MAARPYRLRDGESAKRELDATTSYDGKTIAGTYSYPMELGVVLNAGLSQTLTVVFTPSDTNLYKSTMGTTTINIVPAAIDGRGQFPTRSYGQANPNFTATYTGFARGEGPGELTGVLAFSTIAVPTSIVGSYAVQVGGLSSQNYAIRFEPSVLNIVPATLTFTAVNKIKKFKGPNPSLTFTESGLVDGQPAKMVFKGAPVLSVTATRKSRVGQYLIVLKRGTLQLINSNYIIEFASGVLQVVGKASK